MGLDQYAYAREADEDSDSNVEIAYGENTTDFTGGWKICIVTKVRR